MTKSDLRKVYIQKRLSLSDSEYALLSFQLCQNFFSTIDLSLVKILHTFLPLKKTKEPDTWLIIDRIQKEFPHIRISVPRVNNEIAEVESMFYEGLHQLQESKWGIPEPEHGHPTPHDKIDMVLIPLLIFDNQGNRVGYGKGFYDKFLAQCKPTCLRIGISFFQPVDIIQDIDRHDQTLTHVLTPTAKYEF